MLAGSMNTNGDLTGSTEFLLVNKFLRKVLLINKAMRSILLLILFMRRILLLNKFTMRFLLVLKLEVYEEMYGEGEIIS